MFNFLSRKNVDSVMASFNKTIDDLRSVEQAHASEAEAHQVAAEQAHAAAVAAKAEAVRANVVASRLSELVGTVL